MIELEKKSKKIGSKKIGQQLINNKIMDDGEQLKLERIKIHLQTLFSIINDRNKIIPLVASLSATILIVATFNEKLLPLDNFVKILITILLLVIPISLFDYAMKLRTGERSVAKRFGDLPKLLDGKSCWAKFWANSIYLYIIIVFIVIVSIVFVIWS